MGYCRPVKGGSHLTSVNRWAEPFVTRVLEWSLASGRRCPIVGLAGPQGSGKSTLAGQVVAAARRRGLNACTLSIDDVYLGRRDRRRLARTVHPLLITRGPPGTHDLALATGLLDRLRALGAGQSIRLPRFDKRRDTRKPPSRCPTLAGPLDLVLFEGWFLKLSAEPEAALAQPVNAFERECDADGAFRRGCNRALADYAPLWRCIDRLLWLQPPDFRVVPAWRWQQEQALRARGASPKGMNRRQTERFVQRFERLSRHAMRTLPAIAEWSVALDAERRPAG